MDTQSLECTLEDAVDYLRRYPGYVKLRSELRNRLMYLFLEGDLKKIAKAEGLLCRLTPWSVDEVKAEMNEVAFDPQKVNLDNDSDCHALGHFGREWISVVDEQVKQGDADALEIRLYDAFHSVKKWGKLLYGKERNQVSAEQQKQIDDLCRKCKDADSQPWNGIIFAALEEGDDFSPFGYGLTNAVGLQDIACLKVLMGEHVSIQNKRRAFLRVVKHSDSSSWAAYVIGYCYKTGTVLAKDENLAIKWNYRAATYGCYHAHLQREIDPDQTQRVVAPLLEKGSR